MLHGGASLIARAVAAEPMLRWQFAYWARHLYPNSAAALKLARSSGKILRDALEKEANSSGPVLKAALKRDIDALEQVLNKLAPAAGAAATTAPRLSALGRLENAVMAGAFPGPAGDRLRAAFLRWREAATTYDLADLEAAGKLLADEIQVAAPQLRKAGGFKPSHYYRDRVVSAIKTLRRSAPTDDATKAFRDLEDAINADPALAKIWREQVRPSVALAPHTWDKLATSLDGMEVLKATNLSAIEEAVDRIKGMLGEMFSLSVPAYRDAVLEATRHAEQLAASLNLRALRAAQKAGTAANFTPPHRVVFPQFDLKAPGTSGKGLRLFFDDAVLVVNDAAKPPEAFVLFASQVKAGDASTDAAVEQMLRDQVRLLKGRISVGATEYVLHQPPDVGAITRVFVGTKVPPGVAALSGTIRLVKGPVDGIALAQFAEALLKAAGKIK
jgi:hypothetical protein